MAALKPIQVDRSLSDQEIYFLNKFLGKRIHDLEPSDRLDFDPWKTARYMVDSRWTMPPEAPYDVEIVLRFTVNGQYRSGYTPYQILAMGYITQFDQPRYTKPVGIVNHKFVEISRDEYLSIRDRR
jgi:hypothetical protein